MSVDALPQPRSTTTITERPDVERWLLHLRAPLAIIAVFVVVTALGIFLQSYTAQAQGGWHTLVNVGQSSPARTFIEQELGPLPDWTGVGHDGRFSYVIARDPFNNDGRSALLDDPAYRYRRYLYSLLAGGFGHLSPHGTVAGLVILAAAGMGLAAAATWALARNMAARQWAVLGACMNLGLWISVVMLTADALALGLAFTAVALWVHQRQRLACATLIAAVLTKEVYLLVALGLAGLAWQAGRRFQAVALASVPTGVVVLWNVLVSARVGDAFSDHQALGLPIAGLVAAVAGWRGDGLVALGFLALVGVVAVPTLAWLTRSRLLAWLGLPWVALALCSSSAVWERDASRTFAPLWLMTILGAALWVSERERGLRSTATMTGHAKVVVSDVSTWARSHGREFLTFLGVGLANTVVYFAVYNLMRNEFSALTANAYAVAISVTASYWANRRFTFTNATTVGIARQFTAFVAVSLATLGLSTGTLHALFSLVDNPTLLGEHLALISSTGLLVIVRYGLMRRLVFRVPNPNTPPRTGAPARLSSRQRTDEVRYVTLGEMS